MRARALATLERYVRLETPTGNSAAITELVAMIAERHQDLGGHTVLHPVEGGVHLVSDFPGVGAAAAAAPIVLIGHSDTVWPVGTLTGDVPWVRNAATIAGPGVYDMKSGLVVMEETLALLASAGIDHSPIRIIVTADEEIGSPTSGDLLRESVAGCAAAIGFESPHPNGDLKVGRLGSTRLLLTIVGKESHAALDPDSGISAAEELVDQLLRVRNIVAHASEKHSATSQVLYNLGSITAPGLANVVSGAASALLGFRFSDPQIESDVLSQIEALASIRPGASVTVTRLSYRPAWKPSAADLALADRVRALSPRVGQAPAAGAADTNLLGDLGLPVIDGFGPRGGGAHAASEHIVIDSLWERISLLAGLLSALHMAPPNK
ncbi:MAG TPA: M20/M25/M40 family metallo-hydrolase [Glaciihabitans sp.]|nr:M20/M25/M40 family metallo-hydrolase [Glaciihabitans sp.]